MCPGCMTAAALQELGPNPAATLFGLLVRSLSRPASVEPGTGAEPAKERPAAANSANSNPGG